MTAFQTGADGWKRRVVLGEIPLADDPERI